MFSFFLRFLPECHSVRHTRVSWLYKGTLTLSLVSWQVPSSRESTNFFRYSSNSYLSRDSQSVLVRLSYIFCYEYSSSHIICAQFGTQFSHIATLNQGLNTSFIKACLWFSSIGKGSWPSLCAKDATNLGIQLTTSKIARWVFLYKVLFHDNSILLEDTTLGITSIK